MNYAELVSRLERAALIIPETDDGWAAYLPNIIETAEARCYRDVTFLCASTNATVTVAANQTQITAPADWLIGQRLSVRVGAAFVGMDRRDVSYLFEAGATTGQPRLWAEPTAAVLTIWPTPDKAYQIRLDYEARPTALSAGNPKTWLATNMPDLFFAACMSGVAAYQKNFGAQADNPQAAVSWEAMYATALKSALRDEGRRKGDGTFDSSPSPPPPGNTPTRG